MKAFVICNNDSVEGIVIDDEELAEDIKLKLKQAHFSRPDTKWHYRGYEDYSYINYWHIHEAEVYTKEDL